MTVEIFEQIKMIYFAYIASIPNIVSLWPMTIMPEISKINFQQQTEYDQNQAINYFYTTYFYGILLGNICWPTIINYVSKRNSLLIGQLVQAGSTLGLFFSNNMYQVYMFRFLMGMGLNINSVGKDFIFEISKLKYVQWTFSLKSIFTVFALFVSPLAGYFLYQYTDKNFNLINLFISMLYFLSTFGFFLIFYVFWKPIKQEDQVKVENDEEKVQLLQQKDQEIQLVDQNQQQQTQNETKIENDQQKQVQIDDKNAKLTQNEEEQEKLSLFGAFNLVRKNSSLRNIIIVYLVTNSVFKNLNILTTLYVERDFDKQGLGLSAEMLTFISFFSVIPSTLLLFISPCFVPEKISYKSFMNVIIGLFSLSIFMTPIYRDLITEGNSQIIKYLVIFNQSIVYWCSPKVFSPFINFIVGKSVDRNGRTAINSFAYISQLFCTSILINILTPLYTWSVDNPFAQQFQPLNKNLAFIILVLLLVLALVCLNRTKF